jgi:serine/threonine-protein kinase
MSLDYEVGQRLGDYEVLGVLGAGGMGKVYKVRNVISDRVEAMKILLPNLASQKELADRFLREIKLLASLDHPNIAALRTALTLDDQLVMIMEYVDGVTLSSRLHQGPLPPRDAIKYIDQVLAALSYAHSRNIIHRDIKPANMMLTADGTVKLMDFGIARSSTDRSLTVTGTTLGSLNYMPPEQVKGEPADNRSDLYSLGVSLYELVTGELPFQKDSNYAMMAAHLQETPRPPIDVRPGIPQPLNQIILMAMAKEPAHRFQSADAFRAALKNVPIQGAATQPLAAAAPAASLPTRESSAPASFQESLSHQSQITLMETPALQHAEQPQAAAAAAAPSAPAPAPVVAKSSHRGLYIGLGAFIVVAVLFAAGLYLPQRIKTQAGAEKSMFPPQSQSTPSTPSSSSGVSIPSEPPQPVSPTLPKDNSDSGANLQQAQPTSPASPSAENSSTSSTPTTPTPTTTTTPSSPESNSNSGAAKSTRNTSTAGGRKTSRSVSSNSQQAGAQPAASPDASQTQAADAAEAEEVEQQYDDINSRSAAVSQSLDTLKRQQEAQGYGLRTDIVAAEQHMKTDLTKAQYFMQKQDSKNAKKYLDMAEAELQTIEKFLGH